MLNSIMNRLPHWLYRPPAPQMQSATYTRSAPGQQYEYAYSYGPNAEANLIWYAMSNWVFTAVSTLSLAAAATPLQIHKKGQLGQRQDDHPLLDLIGEYGKPNDYQDSLEFWEQHFGDYLLTGNSYWCWVWMGSQMPNQVYVLDPRHMFIVPGQSTTIDHYEYRINGHTVPLSTNQVTQYSRYNPFNRYYGLSPTEALQRELRSDYNMVDWNRNFFSDSFAPNGIVVVPPETSDKEMERIEAELEAKHKNRRRTAVMRAPVGGTAYIDAAAKHRDSDFTEGRKLSRQAVYEIFGLPLGMTSEASTEAHARVAERFFLRNVHDTMHVRTERKLNSDALWYFTGANRYYAKFADVRVADWQAEAMKLNTLAKFMSRNEIRTQHLNLPPDDVEEQNAALTQSGQQTDRGNAGSIQSDGRSQDDLQAKRDQLTA